MAIAKLLLLLCVALGQHHAGTPPNATPPVDQLRDSEPRLQYFVTSQRALGWIWVSIEGSALVALSGYCPPVLARAILHFLLPTSIDPSTLTIVTPSFVAGTFLALSGSLLRAHCFRALGSRFTFELAIRPNHRLVTDGVYGIVRHPSYTGAFGIMAGWWMCWMNQRGVCAGWLWAATRGVGIISKASDGTGTGGTAVLACVMAMWSGILYVALDKRMNKEDAMLEKNFGEEWRAWARRVPCRLVPGVC